MMRKRKRRIKIRVRMVDRADRIIVLLERLLRSAERAEKKGTG